VIEKIAVHVKMG